MWQLGRCKCEINKAGGRAVQFSCSGSLLVYRAQASPAVMHMTSVQLNILDIFRVIIAFSTSSVNGFRVAKARKGTVTVTAVFSQRKNHFTKLQTHDGHVSNTLPLYGKYK